MDAPTVRLPEEDELHALAQLRWQWLLENEGTPVVSYEDFVCSFVQWVLHNNSSHRPVIMLRGRQIIGMAWLALVPRVPTPYAIERYSGDVQCVYVVPQERNRGHGGLLIEAVIQLAQELGLGRVTVHSSDRAIPAYRRHGFDLSPRLLQAEVTVVAR